MVKRARITLIILTLFAVGILVFACGDGGESGEEGEITGIYAVETEVTYDGREHGVEIVGTTIGDKIFYSESGASWSTAEIKYTDAGEYSFYYKVVRTGYKDYVGIGKIKINKAILQGISASDTRVVYDGNAHGIEITGVESDDEVLFSDDGINFGLSVTKTDVGRYTIFYVVNRGNYEYRSSTVLLILPEIRGTYFNSALGEIHITDTNYDENGRGEMDGKEFVVEDGVLTFDGAQYKKVGDDEAVYELRARGKSVFILGSKESVTVEIEIDIASSVAIIKHNGETVMTVENVNYCENGSEIVLTEKCTEIVFVLLLVPEIDDIYELVIYDGAEHGHTIEGEWDTDINPKYTDVGRYEDFITVRKDGYVEKRIRAVLVIAEDISGIYFDDTDIIVINRDRAEINGVDFAMSYAGGCWEADGNAIQITDDGISYGGKAFARAVLNAVRIEIGGKVIVCADVEDVTILVVGGTVIVDVGGDTVFEIAGSVLDVTANGSSVDAVYDEEAIFYMLGNTNLKGGVIIVVTLE